MELEISKELIIIYIERYYREQLNFDGNVKIRLVTKEEGYYGDKVKKVDIKIEGHVDINGENVPCIIPVTVEDMNNIITYYLKDVGYNVIKVENNILDENEYDYFETVSKFKGVKVKVKKDEKLLVKKVED